MTRASSTSRWLITTLLAVWLPLCFCQAAGVLRVGLGVIGGMDDVVSAGDACCPCDSNGDAPVTALSQTACCGVSIKIAPEPDHWSPDQDATGTPMVLPPIDIAEAPGVLHAPVVSSDLLLPLAAQTLLRQHCALII